VRANRHDDDVNSVYDVCVARWIDHVNEITHVSCRGSI